VDAWIEVRSAAGASLKGARVSGISIRTPENTETFIWRGMEQTLGFEFAPSDDAGRLNLPPLPEGALIDVRIDHPEWAQIKLSNLKVTGGRLSEASMPAGVMTTFELVADSRTPTTLDGLVCETLLMSRSSTSAETLRLPLSITGDRIRFCAHPVTYSFARLKVSGVAITPQFDRLTISAEGEKKVRFLVRKTVNVSGRVVHRDGTPHSGALVFGQIENISPDGPVPGADEWAVSGTAETDAEGKYTLALAPGRSRIEASIEGFVTDRDYAELDVQAGGPNDVGDFVSERLQPVRGQVVDERGQAVPGAIVRVRHPSITGQPAVTDADGKFAITLPWIPLDLDTRKRSFELDVAAFVADRPLEAVTRIDLRRADSSQSVHLVLRPQASADALLSLEDSKWYLAKTRQAESEQEEGKYPAGQRGQPAPELDAAAWFNTDARSLHDLRGRYVLLDFWFIGCGPCHQDFPSVKLVHEQFEKLGVTVIGVHNNSSDVEAVREHCRQQGLTFPIAVDHTDGRILDAYRQLGLTGFPSYILIGPDGKILENDNTRDRPSLRAFKLEIIRKYVLEGRN
ncbi:MAG TPA: redoxin domain-containing protein, partial [Pirellulales bacterium]|nr:redoxin domain-containing protein [Pirellulales bacterium]